MKTQVKARLSCAIAQFGMHEGVQANLNAMLRTMAQAAEEGAQLVISPELSLTGFHRKVPELCGSPAIMEGISHIERCCREVGIACGFGYPWVDKEGEVRNRYVVVDKTGALILTQDKMGLTPSEQRLFSPGQERNTVTFGDWRVGVVMCREILDVSDLTSLQGSVDLLLWPAYIQWEGGPDDYEASARHLATTLGAWIVQSNWPTATNDPSLRGLGRSIVVSPKGELSQEAPFDEPCVRVVRLDESVV